MIFNPTPDKLILGKTKSRRPFFERKHKKSRSNVGLSMDSLKNNIKMNVNVNPKLQNIYMNLKPKKRTTHTKPSPLLKKTSNLKKSITERQQGQRKHHGSDMFKILCNLRIKTNTLETVLNNECFMLKKQIEFEKEDINTFLDDIVNVAQNLKRNFNENYENQFKDTFKFLKKQIGCINQIKSSIDYKIANFAQLKLKNDDLNRVVEEVYLNNKLCRFPFENKGARDKHKEELIRLIQDISLPTPIRKTVSPIDEYNELINEIKLNFDTSQTSTLVKKKGVSKKMNMDIESEENELNLKTVKSILNKNDEELNKLGQFNIFDSKDEIESRLVESKSDVCEMIEDARINNEISILDMAGRSSRLKKSVSSISLKCSEMLNTNRLNGQSAYSNTDIK